MEHLAACGFAFQSRSRKRQPLLQVNRPFATVQPSRRLGFPRPFGKIPNQQHRSPWRGERLMSPLRRVLGDRAGPTAVGILVPPGPRTVVILRPRALAWDLLLVRGDATFQEIESHEAEAIVQGLARALEDWI